MWTSALGSGQALGIQMVAWGIEQRKRLRSLGPPLFPSWHNCFLGMGHPEEEGTAEAQTQGRNL